MSLVSENIRYLRKLNGLTQEQFARRLGIKRSLVGAYEEARANPNPNNMIAIAKAFNVTVENLQRQDLRKLRETPNLSFDRGAGQSSSSSIPSRSIFREPAPEPADDSLFADDPLPMADNRPDLSDVPKPLASVLEKYYRAPSAVPPPAGPQPASGLPFEAPVISDPVRPGSVMAERGNLPVPPEAPRPVPPAPNPADRAPFEVRSSPAPVVPEPAGAGPLVFNNAYEQPAPSPIAQPREETGLPPIPLVMQYQFSEYAQRSGQHDYINRLPSLRLPTLPVGHYRAFEADGDFSLPGALLVGQFVRNWFDIVDGRLYVLMLAGQRLDGARILCRRVFNQVKIKGTLLLTADSPHVPSREVPLKEVQELWEVKAFFSQQLPDPAPNLDRLRQLVEEMRFEVDRIK
ncbi:helix-turn-helix domain-containing protein [Rudanella paleaurantiibacter]|uniref:Helix-turn-helix domain-containing protein n=1 Tax=Rudanella paleaurantiibacter TaxID=2614655 RepID=A0A7J5U105_9BACT|nr:helix-turn-helix transcriptional regulator [Rudanella paleaurantiibacter]KAB7730270.1 helix-turn-helix domain-containing protein [Rudanella paleaurantiibacter]